jgi:hypothetical protein
VIPWGLSLTIWGVLPTLKLADSMGKTQWLALNIAGGICGLLIVCTVVLGLVTGRLNAEVARKQAEFNQAQQVQSAAQTLVSRIAQASQTDPALRSLLERHDFRLNTAATSPAR